MIIISSSSSSRHPAQAAPADWGPAENAAAPRASEQTWEAVMSKYLFYSDT